MILCLSVRLARKAEKAIGTDREPVHLFWLEPELGDTGGDASADERTLAAAAAESLRKGRVKWFRSRPITYMMR